MVSSIKEFETYINNSNTAQDEGDIMSDVRYICSSCSLITEALQKGCDVLQMPNGDVIVTELRPFTYQYKWDEKKGKLVRVQAGGRSRRLRNAELSKKEAEDFYFENSEDSIEDEQVEKVA